MLLLARRLAAIGLVLASALPGCSEASSAVQLDAQIGASIPDAGVDGAGSTCVLPLQATLPEWRGEPPPIVNEVYDPVADSDKYPNELDKGTDLQRMELTASEALCNDGTRAQLYVRPAAPGFERKWVFYLQGGGGCVGHEDCLRRWQGKQDGGYDATKMSSRYNPDMALAEGIFERSARNPLGGWNQVYFYSCSSDAFSGTNANAILYDPTNPEAKAFSLRFLGRRILEGALAQLKNGASATLRSSPGIVPYQMPALKDAEAVLLTGSSGGSVAVRRNVDWFRTQFGSAVHFGAIAEASIITPASHFGGERGAQYDECDAKKDYYARIHPNSHRTVGDESCRAAHAEAGEEWRCFDGHHLLHHHITTKLMLRQDLTDPKADGLARTIGMSLADWLNVQRDYLRTLVNRTEFSHTPEPIETPPSVFAPNCGAHIVFHKDWYYQHKIMTGGAETSMNDAVTHWLKGGAPSFTDDTTGAASICTK